MGRKALPERRRKVRVAIYLERWLEVSLRAAARKRKSTLSQVCSELLTRTTTSTSTSATTTGAVVDYFGARPVVRAYTKEEFPYESEVGYERKRHDPVR